MHVRELLHAGRLSLRLLAVHVTNTHYSPARGVFVELQQQIRSHLVCSIFFLSKNGNLEHTEYRMGDLMQEYFDGRAEYCVLSRHTCGRGLLWCIRENFRQIFIA